MPTQIFMIEMAPEAKPITAKEIQYYLYNTHFDSEFIVREMSQDALQDRQNDGIRCKEGSVNCWHSSSPL